MILIKKIIEAALKNPAQTAFIFQDKSMTYGQFLSFFALVTKRLVEAGIKSGDVVGVSMDQSPLHVAVILGIARLGAISVPMIYPASEDHYKAIIQKFSITKVVCAEHVQSMPIFEVIRLDRLTYNENEYDFSFLDYEPDDDIIVRIYLTSGSTGIPSGISYNQGYWYQRILQTFDDIDAKSRLIAPDLHLTLGSISALGTLLAGATVIFPKDNTYQNFIIAINLYAATHIILPPFAISGLFNFIPKNGIVFPTLKHMRIVGSTPPLNMIEQVSKRLTPNIFVPYGLTEIGAISIAGHEDLKANPQSSGKPQIDTEVEIVDSNHTILPLGEVGEIRVKKKGMPKSYFNDSDKTKQKFKDGFFYTGDLGYFDEAGSIVIEGRMDDMINLDGDKIHPLPYEQSLLLSGDIKDVALFPIKNMSGQSVLAAAFVAEKDHIIKALASNPFIANLISDRYMILNHLPRNESGKLLRKPLAEHFKHTNSIN